MRKTLIAITFFSILFFFQEIISMPASRLSIELKTNGDTLYLANPNYRLQTGLYDVYRTTHANIVMLGNSITHGVNWFELLGRNDMVERGIPSDIIEGLLGRMDYVYNLHPKICFVMGGINDIYSGIPINFIFKYYTKVIEGLKENGIIPVIQSTLYVSPKWHYASNKNPEVEKLNKMLMEYASQNKIDFIDLNALLSANKFLIDRFTYDGLHLRGEAYKIWGVEVEKILNKNGL